MGSVSVEELKDRLDNAEARYLHERDRLVQSALLHASDKFITDETDPGWGSELHEDMVDDQIEKTHAAKQQFLHAARLHAEAVRLAQPL